MSEYDVCVCGHLRSSHAVHAPHYCHDDCQCDVFSLDALEPNLATLERAVIDAAVSEYEIHLAAAREHITKGRQYCKCRICVTVKALLAERGKP